MSCLRQMGPEPASNSPAKWCKSSWPVSINGWLAIYDGSRGATHVFSRIIAGLTPASTLVTKSDEEPISFPLVGS